MAQHPPAISQPQGSGYSIVATDIDQVEPTDCVLAMSLSYTKAAFFREKRPGGSMWARTSAGVKISEIFAKPEFDPDEICAYARSHLLTPFNFLFILSICLQCIC